MDFLTDNVIFLSFSGDLAGDLACSDLILVFLTVNDNFLGGISSFSGEIFFDKLFSLIDPSEIDDKLPSELNTSFSDPTPPIFGLLVTGLEIGEISSNFKLSKLSKLLTLSLLLLDLSDLLLLNEDALLNNFSKSNDFNFSSLSD